MYKLLNYKFFLPLLTIILILTTIFFYSKNYIDKKTENLIDVKYSLLEKQLHKQIKTLISDKQNATLALAISSAKLPLIKQALKSDSPKNLNLKDLSNEIRDNTKFKNIWFQLLNKKGQSIYRTWSDKKGDSLKFRYDVIRIIKNKKTQSTISVGRYDMTFKSMIPIFEGNEFLGVFEVISHFNSISKILSKNNNQVLILANKKFYENIKYPFSKKFIGKNYIANLDANNKTIDFVKNLELEKILKQNSYLIKENFFISNYKIKNKDNTSIGNILIIKDINEIDISNIQSLKKEYFSYIIIFSILFFLLLFMVFAYFNSKKLKLDRKKVQNIIDSQTNIIVITDGVLIRNANQPFLDFFEKYESLKDFKKDHNCICEKFIDLDSNEYIIDKDYDGNNWAEYILKNKDKNFKCAMFKNEKLEHFKINVNQYDFNEKEPFIIISLTNITNDIKQKQELQNLNNNLEKLVTIKTVELKNLNEQLKEKINEEVEKSQEKDKIIYQQNKMLSMNEMINNIAHHWRQPLSAISSSASSMILKSELNELDKNDVEFLCKHIVDASSHLTQTIEDFRNLFDIEEKKSEFKLNEIINTIKLLLKDTILQNNIKIINKIDDKMSLTTYKNSFRQVLLNLFKNSIEALKDNENLENKVIILEIKNNTFSILDNAKGINENITDKVFEPYFTTKHKSQGKGLGLYMVKNISEQKLNFKLSFENISFQYENRDCKGVKFNLNLNT